MKYEDWRSDVFGQAEGSDPVLAELQSETYSCSIEESFDHIDRALVDPEIHDLFTKDQIGTGVNLIYSNCCSDLPFCYIEAGDEDRRLAGIGNLTHLYTNFFSRYCPRMVTNIGNDRHDGRIGYICYMFWDLFVLYPGNASSHMIEATLKTMESAIQLDNESCIVSAIHGLGHWAAHTPTATRILESWLRKPTTSNQQVLEYAQQATSGCIL